MEQQYYKLPLKIASVFDESGRRLATCSEVNSIDQYIELLLITCPGEHKFNKSFGCGIWDMDFENVTSRQSWQEDFSKHIIYAIQTFEKRLKEVSVEIQVNDVARHDYSLQTTAIKKEVKVYVTARLVSNNEPCKFYYALYLGPLAAE